MNTNADDFEPDQINASSLAQDLATEIDSLLINSNSSLLSSIVLDEKAAKEAELEKLEDLGKEHSRWRAEVEGLHEASAGRLKLKRLSKAQKIELFKTIRFSFMKHEELLALTMNPTFELAKQYIIEGLSVRLNPFENGIKDSIAINIEPRANYDPNVCRDAGAALHHGEKAGAAAGAAAGGKGQPGAPAANMKTGMTYNQYNNDLSQHNTPG